MLYQFMQRKHGVIVLIFAENKFLCVDIRIQNINFQPKCAITFFLIFYKYIELFCALCDTFYSLTVPRYSQY